MDMDIEADLGIDSIKRVEILSTLEENIPGLPTVSPEIMGSMKTLGQVAEYLSGTNTVANTQTQTEIHSQALSGSYPPIPQKSHDLFPKEISAAASKKSFGMVDRKIVSLVDKPFDTKDRLSIPGGRKVFITDDHTGLSEAICSEFASLNIHTVLVSDEMLQDFLQGNTPLANAGGLVVLPDNRPKRQAQWDPQDIKFLKDAFLLTKLLAPDLIDSAGIGGAFFATITRLDGAFGFNGQGMKNPLQGGLAGLAKTAAIEWPAVSCHAIDIAPEWKAHKAIAKAIVAELLNPDSTGPIEIGLGSNSRRVLELEASPYPQGEVNLNPDDVVVVTGGARGITASVAHALANHAKPTLILLGRSPRPTPEPDWLASLEDEAAVKKAIVENEFSRKNVTPKQIEKSFKTHMVNREIMKNLGKMTQSGASVFYYSVDIRDLDAVQSIVADVRSAHGPITGIIHGAGTLEDRLIIDKTMAQFDNVFDTKVKGLHVLLETTKTDALKYIVLFSSITARIGNNGQADYAMANEVLNKIAQQESTARSNCKVLSINWGPWDGGMVCSALKRKFERNGVELIPADAGANCMIHEMTGDSTFPVEVVIGAKIISEKDKSDITRVNCNQEQLSLTLKSEIDMDRFPILGAHILGGRPVVPLSLIAEWLGHGALHENPGLFFHGLDDMRVLQGIKINQRKKMIRLMAGKPRKKGALFEIDVEIRDGNQNNARMIHSKATAILTDSLGAPPSFATPEHIGTNAYLKSMDEVYERILFHGNELRGIQEIIGYSTHGMVARISAAPLPEKWITNPIRSKWISDPLVIDSAFQMAIIWCFEQRNVVSLPSYCASYRQYRSDFPSEGVTAVFEAVEMTRHKLAGNFTFLDAQGVVVARLSGYEAVMDASLSKAFKPQHAA
jgi:NAD(P)-dependent dehydrogenase (short-subunit alcohol dehydrogenase family)